MAKITVTLTAQYDDGKTIKEAGETISMDDKLAKQLAALGMVELPVKETKAKGKNAKAPDSDGGDDPDNPALDNLDPDDMGDS